MDGRLREEMDLWHDAPEWKERHDNIAGHSFMLFLKWLISVVIYCSYRWGVTEVKVFKWASMTCMSWSDFTDNPSEQKQPQIIRTLKIIVNLIEESKVREIVPYLVTHGLCFVILQSNHLRLNWIKWETFWSVNNIEIQHPDMFLIVAVSMLSLIMI